MEPIDRYLKAVRSCLPRGQRDDILKELAENLRAQMEDREAELGRPLLAAEQEDILTRHGHPVVVAGRYRQDHRSLAFGRQLIGPAVFPLYARILWINVGVTLAVCAAAAVAFASGHPFFQSVPAILFQVLVQFGIVTLIFAAVDFGVTRFPGSWNPRNRPAARFGSADGQRVPRAESIAQLAVLAVLVSVLRGLRPAAEAISGAAAGGLRLTPLWHAGYLALLALLLAQMAQAAVNLIRPQWTRFRAVARLVFDGVWLGIVLFFLQAGHWVTAASPLGESLRKAATLDRLILFVLWNVV
ncbi:MAG TPA: hypothetical protein VOA87_13105, partial [Thermoanaerobaculia bacterium]|nr:hypothetical protein [Thermoanaerobaculia bacterium]